MKLKDVETFFAGKCLFYSILVFYTASQDILVMKNSNLVIPFLGMTVQSMLLLLPDSECYLLSSSLCEKCFHG